MPMPCCQHMYSLVKTLLLWDQPHYRAPSFAADLRDNLRNVAVPGTGACSTWRLRCSRGASERWLSTACLPDPRPRSRRLRLLHTRPGVPLSVFCVSRGAALFFLLVLNPLLSLVAACYMARSSGGSTSVADAYWELLLAPRHWFAIWRHNCLLMGCGRQCGGPPCMQNGR